MSANEQAYPSIERNWNWNPDREQWEYKLIGGLTKREYAAIAAMQGLIASCAHHQSGGSNLSAYPSLPKDAVEIADALLAELDKEQK